MQADNRALHRAEGDGPAHARLFQPGGSGRNGKTRRDGRGAPAASGRARGAPRQADPTADRAARRRRPPPGDAGPSAA
ncbi:hypothetical protein GCM10010964_38360 [Caldovatus sediminis]|uniref:Uncharacterized protein n=1 Tax=Caldovatus sediminis TaxID=2041189 RepID=A0A8J2ZE53_9PROT|nr:hypothetical protein GCM10010964_38360 [Caldovatus sediminis]